MLGGADEIEISFTLEGPVLAWLDPCPPSVRLFRRGTEAIIAERQCACVCRLASRTSKFEARFPGQVLNGIECVRVAIRDSRRGDALAEFELAVLNVERAQQLRLNALRADNQCLWYQCGNHWRPGDAIPDTSDAVSPEFTILATGLSTVLPPLKSSLTYHLISGDRRIPLSVEPVTLAGTALKVKGPRVFLRDKLPVPIAGSFSITASLAGMELATFPFRILSREEWLRSVEVRPLALLAETIEGRLANDARVLRRRKHTAFQPVLRIETPVPAPNTLLRCDWRLALGNHVVASGDFLVRLNATACDVALERFDLRAVGIQKRCHNARLLLSVSMDGREKLAWPIVAMTADPVSNFEGQLRQDANELPVDEEAYGEILAGLAVPQAGAIKRTA